MKTPSITQLGLTGGIGSGKSVVANALREAGITVIDLDELGRTITNTNLEVQQLLVDACGTEIGSPGALDRAKLRQLVFADSNIRHTVEGILHPIIWKTYEELVEKAADAGEKLVVCEAALLVEHSHTDKFDALIVVICPEDVRRNRLVEHRGLPTKIIDQILETQTTDEARLNAATYIIDNSRSLQELEEQTKSLVLDFKRLNWL